MADVSMTSKSDEGALKEAKITVEEVERQRLELEKRGSLVSVTSSINGVVTDFSNRYDRMRL